MTILITGIAGFIGFHVAQRCLARAIKVVGVDVMDPYYALDLKHDRLAQLFNAGFTHYYQRDLADPATLLEIANQHTDVTHVIHLAAQPGLRYSMEAPMHYLRANVVAHMHVLEACRHYFPNLRHVLYASSSSVYGGAKQVPFQETMALSQPLSFYAATKLADEQMAYSYSHLYNIPLTGLRFFTVYGPWGRPDMAVYRFTDAIVQGTPVMMYGDGLLERDFTYIDDIVDGVMAALDRTPEPDAQGVRHCCYNLGGANPLSVKRLIEVISECVGMPVKTELAPMPLGDVPRTFADIRLAKEKFGYCPRYSIEKGISAFVAWYRTAHRPSYTMMTR